MSCNESTRNAVSVQTLQPTAANVSVSGRIATENGLGISNASVILTDSAGYTRKAFTGSFGYYSFDDVESGGIYTISVTHKRYTFADSPRVVNVQDNLADVDFIAAP